MISIRKTVGIVGVGLVTLGLGACGNDDAAENLQAKDNQIAGLQAQISQSAKSVQFWNQLTGLMQPVQMPSMKDHRAFMLPSGVVLALHFDDFDLDKAQNLNWVAWGVPGKFCSADQQAVEAKYGKGFTHFHDMKNDVHGGAPGAEGVWFVHIAVRDFNSPMSGGPISQGIDHNFMPTKAPAC